MAQTVKWDGLDQLGKSWSELLKRFPEEKRRVLFEVGQELLTQVRELLSELRYLGVSQQELLNLVKEASPS
jgi:DNA-binding transcriptional regulator YhcF (GntR family)